MGDSRSGQPPLVLRSAGADGADRRRRVRRRRAVAHGQRWNRCLDRCRVDRCTGAEMLQRWRADRQRLLDAASTVDPSTRVPWYGPAMGARSFITARLMETWAHGQDVVDALGVDAPADGTTAPRCAHRCAGPAVQLRRPRHDDAGRRRRRRAHGTRWRGRGDGASLTTLRLIRAQRGLRFCARLLPRRHAAPHVADTALEVVGDAAVEWMSIAQAFAGRRRDRSSSPGQFPITDR